MCYIWNIARITYVSGDKVTYLVLVLCYQQVE
ncbi:hypothetical protein VCHENC02_0441, partial [Vibrio harveyi]